MTRCNTTNHNANDCSTNENKIIYLYQKPIENIFNANGTTENQKCLDTNISFLYYMLQYYQLYYQWLQYKWKWNNMLQDRLNTTLKLQPQYKNYYLRDKIFFFSKCTSDKTVRYKCNVNSYWHMLHSFYTLSY